MIVLKVSTGVKIILKSPAQTEAQAVFTPTGNVRVKSYELSIASIPEFAAVSPKRDIGPCTRAGPTPL